ncbi:MAG: hypothetical protein ACYDGX_10110, partial [Thermoleophilia bacterium]
QSGYWWDHWVTVHDWKYEWVPTSIDDPNYHGGPPYSYGNYVDGSYGSGGHSWYGSSSYAAYVHSEAVAAYQRAKRQAAVQLQQKMQREAEAATQVAKEYEQSANVVSGGSGGVWSTTLPEAYEWGESNIEAPVMMATWAPTGVAAAIGLEVLVAPSVIGVVVCAPASAALAAGGGMLSYGEYRLWQGSDTYNAAVWAKDKVRDGAGWAWDNTLGRL